MGWNIVGVIVTFTCSLLAATLVVEAQQAHVPRIGVLALTATPEREQALFREGLRERGYVEGHNIRVEYRWVWPDKPSGSTTSPWNSCNSPLTSSWR